jgi:hypothetical protein
MFLNEKTEGKNLVTLSLEAAKLNRCNWGEGGELDCFAPSLPQWA